MKRRLILFPGLAADERMYDSIHCSTCELVTPRLLIPRRGETMVDYARRHRDQLMISDEDIVGGCSFGSLVASEIVRQQPCRGLILLSGALSSQGLVHQAQQLNRWSRWIPYGVVRHALSSRWFLQRVFGGGEERHMDLGRTMIRESSPQLVREGGRLAVSYFPAEEVSVRVFSLHGAQDRVIHPPQLSSGMLIEEAGHGMVVSHAVQVSQFLEECCSACG